MNVGRGHPLRVWSVSLPTGIVVLVVAGAAPLIGWALAQGQLGILALPIVVVLTPVVMRWPVISTFGLYAFLVPFDEVAVFGGATLTKMVGVLAAAVLLGVALMERRLSRPPKAALWWALFLLWAAMSAAWAIVEPILVIRGLQTILSLFLLYFIAVSIRVSEKELAWVCALTVLGAALAAGWAVFYGLDDATGSAAGTGRGTLMIGERAMPLNAFAASLIPALSLAMGGFIGLRSWIGKMLSAAAVGMISAGIFFTMSRGALVGIAAMALVFLYRFRVRWQVLLLVCLLVGVAATMPGVFFDRILAVGDKDATGAGRTKIWAVGIEALANHGLVGAGFKTFLDVYGRTVPIPPGKGERGAHNMYLAIWVEVGIVGLALLVGAVACQLLAARRAAGSKDSGTTTIAVRATEAACYGMLVSVFFGDFLWSKFFWLPWILLAWGVHTRERQPLKPVNAQPEEAHA
jgi:O-antigen ligase